MRILMLCKVFFDSLSDDFMSGGLETVKAVMTGQEIENPQTLTEEDTAKVDRFVDNAILFSITQGYISLLKAS